jgi:NOL1/NOP2/fmu family ribosome biogenesis protein
VCGQRDLGTGFFEDIECSNPIYETQLEEYEEAVYREEPVYEAFYIYEIDKWLVVRSESDSGRDHNAQWPPLNLAETEREGGRSESYIIFFVNNDDEEYSLELPLAEWQDYEMGQNVLLKLDVFGNLDEVEP